jgi:hypothetical protein
VDQKTRRPNAPSIARTRFLAQFHLIALSSP